MLYPSLPDMLVQWHCARVCATRKNTLDSLIILTRYGRVSAFSSSPRGRGTITSKIKVILYLYVSMLSVVRRVDRVEMGCTRPQLNDGDRGHLRIRLTHTVKTVAAKIQTIST